MGPSFLIDNEPKRVCAYQGSGSQASSRLSKFSDRLWAGLRRRLADSAGERVDPLTQLASRSDFHTLLNSSAWASPGSGTVAALFIDLDNFKSINDVHGYRTGDAVLTLAAERLTDLQQPSDILGRNGGDEFVLILTTSERAANAIVIAEDIRESLASPFAIGEDRLHLTASVGVAVHERDAATTDQLLRHADIALMSAKRDGRDRSTTFDIRQAERARELQTQTDLVRSSLDEDRLTMLFQPVVDNFGKPVGVEALARCATPQGELVAPTDFYAGAETETWLCGSTVTHSNSRVQQLSHWQNVSRTQVCMSPATSPPSRWPKKTSPAARWLRSTPRAQNQLRSVSRSPRPQPSRPGHAVSRR